MDRRRILLVAAAVVATLGAALVFVYVQGAENRAEDRFDVVEVLVAIQQIEVGETIVQAEQSGKVALKPVTRDSVVINAVATLSDLEGTVALTTIYPGEQLLSTKFGAAIEIEAAASTLPIPEGQLAISVNLTDPARVAGFVNPGSEVAIFLSGTADFLDAPELAGVDFTRVLLPRITVLGVGSTTQVTTTTTDETGAQTTEQLPSTLLTLALDQRQVERVLFAQGHGELAFGLLTVESIVRPGAGITGPDLFG